MGSERVDREGEHGKKQSMTGSAVASAPVAVQRTSSLVVGPANDPAEHEADVMAASVVAILRSGSVDAVPSGVNGDGGRIRRSAVGLEGGPIDRDTESKIQSARGGGSPLAPDVQSKMGAAFGADFSRIRVHSGAQSAELNDRIQAKAFTVGSDVYFRDGAPDAGSASGQQLLAHELTHTIQQGGAVRRATSTGAGSPGRIRPTAQRTIQRTPAIALLTTDIAKPDAADPSVVDDTDTGKSKVSINPSDALDVDFDVSMDGKTTSAPYVQVTSVGRKNLGRGGRYVKKSAVAPKDGRATPTGKSSSAQTGKAIGKGTSTVGILPEINDAQDAFKARGNVIASDMEKGMGVAAGAGDSIAMFTGLAASIVAFRDRDASKGDKAGAVLGGISSIGGGAKGASAMADKGGAGTAATSASQGIAGFADAFSGIKDTFFAIKHIIELAQKADSLNNKEKFKASMQIITEAMSAAKSGVSSAKAFMELWGGGAAAPLVGSVPGLGIALSAVDIIIRAVDLVDALIRRSDMQNRKRAIKTGDLLGGAKGTSLKKDAEAFMTAIDAKKMAGTEVTEDEELKYAQYEEYLLAKGLQYISTKRANRAILKISVAVGKMAGDVAVLGGASAPVGVGIKAGAMALDVGASVFRRFKQWGRDKAAEKEAASGAKATGFFGLFNTDKSSAKKLEGYNKMVDKTFDMIIKVTTITVAVEQKKAADQVEAFVGAMGLSIKQMDAKKGDPTELRTAMIVAMKKRE
jgi:hypothetical protein